MLKKEPPSFEVDVQWKTALDEEEAYARIRCPLCAWQPSATSVWMCQSFDTPEPYFGGCGAIWNTFTTHGRCPGCAHQWQWTSCHRCNGWSLHEDWYEMEDR